MKKLFASLLLIFCLIGCSTTRNLMYVGMSEKEFRKKNSGESIAEQTQFRTVYRIRSKQYGNNLYTFIYVKDGVVYQIDEGKFVD